MNLFDLKQHNRQIMERKKQDQVHFQRFMSPSAMYEMRFHRTGAEWEEGSPLRKARLLNK